MFGDRSARADAGSIRRYVYAYLRIDVNMPWGQYAVFSSVMDLAAMGHSDDQDEKLVIVDLVHDAVVAGTDPPLPRATDEPGCSRWSRLGREQFKGCLDAAANVGVELAKFTRC